MNESQTMSTFEQRCNHLKRIIYGYQRTMFKRKNLLKKHNEFLNSLRDTGRISKEEIEIFFKK